MDFVIVTGISGAGKSQVIRSLDDLDFYYIDNIPPALIPRFAQLYYNSSNNKKRVALVCDIRGGHMFDELSASLTELTRCGHRYEILFLEASDETLINRYKETRRRHPLSKSGRVTDAIKKERRILKPIRDKANHIIDTSKLTPKQLTEHIRSIYGAATPFKGIMVNVISFGTKYGVPLDSDLIFDVRFLPNPFYIEELKSKTGLDEDVANYVMKSEQARVFLDKLCDMVEYLLPYYTDEGKSQLVISIGCTGGMHRSVTISEEFAKRLREENYHVIVTHRDNKKDVLA